MNRLREESGLDPISEKGIEMLRAVRPTASSPLLKRRVWAALQASTIASPVRQRSSMLRVVVVGVGLVAFTATAAATIGGRRIATRIEQFLGPLGGGGAGVAQPRSERTKPVRVVAEAPKAPEVEMLPESAASQEPAQADSRAAVAGSAPASSTHVALRPTRTGSLAVETTRERAQVWEALVALRRDHDPNHAAALLNHELEANPHGVLRQEALVLAIEAADARGDRRGAEGFARAYQREFPTGRFMQLAQRYLDEKNARVRALPSNP